MMYRILWGENAPKSDQKTVFQERTQPTLRVREQRRGAKGQRAMEWEKRCQMLPAANDLALILAEPPRETTGAQRWVSGLEFGSGGLLLVPTNATSSHRTFTTEKI